MQLFNQQLGLFMVQEFKDTNLKTIGFFFILRQSHLTHEASSENMGRTGVRKSDKLSVNQPKYGDSSNNLTKR